MAHDHDHAPRNFGRAFAIGVTMNLAFVVVEAFYGWKTGSLALLADAAHNLSDVGGLAAGLGRLWCGAVAPQYAPQLWLA